MFIDAPEAGSEERVATRFVDLSQELRIEPREQFSVAAIEQDVLSELRQGNGAVWTTWGDPVGIVFDSGSVTLVGDGVCQPQVNLKGGDCRTGDTRRYLARLAEVLRNKTEWPEGFEWDFSWYPTCAMGLSMRLFGVQIEFSPVLTTVDVDAMFYDGVFGIKAKWAQRLVTPNMVARRIERYLARTNA